MRTIWLAVWIIALCGVSACSLRTRTDIYLIPKGSSGWFVIVYDQPAWPALEVGNNSEVYRFGADKLLITSTQFKEGRSRPEFYSLDESGNRVHLPMSLMGGGGMVWGQRAFYRYEFGKVELSGTYFFVGSESAFEQSSEKEREEMIASVREKFRQGK